jgi:hypothetical protein
LRVGPSATSNAFPVELTPFAFKAPTVSFTASSVRAQMATSHPSSARVSAMPRPMPRVPPVTMAFFPLSPRSMVTFLFVEVSLFGDDDRKTKGVRGAKK